MNDRQNRLLKAAKDGDEVLQNHNTDIAGNTPLLDKKTALEDWILNIQELEQKQNLDIKGYAEAKRNALEEMGVKKALPIAKLVKQFAKSINDDVLKQEVDFVKDDFRPGRGEDILDRCKLVRNRANTHSVAMIAAGYQITAAMITALSTAITDYELKQDTPGSAESDKSAATVLLKDEFTDYEEMIDDIIDLVTPYAQTNTELYYAVNDGFEINDSGNRITAARITVSDNAVNTRLRNANVRIVELNLTKKSSKRGIADFSQDVMPEGNYTIEITLAGYQTLTIPNTAVFTDQITRIDARLIKI